MTFYPRTTLIALVILSLLTVSLAQTQSPPKRKKVKNFGSSLKRLKWNPQKNAAEMSSEKPDTIADEGDVIRIDTSLVSSDLLVLDQHGKSISGLTAENFAITEDGVAQNVGHFLTGDNVNNPRTIVLLMDYSGSQMPYLYNSVQAAKVLVDKLGPKDLMAIVTDDVELIQDFTTDKKKLKEKLDSLVDAIIGQRRPINDDGSIGRTEYVPRLGRSKQYSALMATLKEVFQEDDVRRIIIFQTDGDEAASLRNPKVEWKIPPGLKGKALKVAEEAMKLRNQSAAMREAQFALEDLYQAVEKERVTLYTVIPGARLWGLPLDEQVRRISLNQSVQTAGWMGHLSPRDRAQIKEWLEKDAMNVDETLLKSSAELMSKQQAILASLATVSGGWADFLEVPEQADAIYSRIFSDINQRYIVGYYPTNKERDGKRRKIEIKVKGHPEYQVYGRLSYFAPEP